MHFCFDIVVVFLSSRVATINILIILQPSCVYVNMPPAFGFPSKDRNGILNVRNDLRVCCAYEGETARHWRVCTGVDSGRVGKKNPNWSFVLTRPMYRTSVWRIHGRGRKRKSLLTVVYSFHFAFTGSPAQRATRSLCGVEVGPKGWLERTLSCWLWPLVSRRRKAATKRFTKACRFYVRCTTTLNLLIMLPRRLCRSDLTKPQTDFSQYFYQYINYHNLVTHL